jgi:hypothetical protein
MVLVWQFPETRYIEHTFSLNVYHGSHTGGVWQQSPREEESIRTTDGSRQYTERVLDSTMQKQRRKSEA